MFSQPLFLHLIGAALLGAGLAGVAHAQQLPASRDTSFTVRSAFVKEKKHHPAVSNETTAYYAEFDNRGPGATSAAQRVPWAHQSNRP